MSETLFDLPPVLSGFQMQSHHKGIWKPQEDGAARSVWLPRTTREEAVHKCLEWTGAICIPAMRVIDLATGDVVWMDRSEYDPDAGEPITPAWTEEIYAQVHAENKRRADANRCECGMPWGTEACRNNHPDRIPPHRIEPDDTTPEALV